MANRFTSDLKFKFRALDSFCHIGNGDIFCGLLFFFFCVCVFFSVSSLVGQFSSFFDLGGVDVWTIKNCKADCISSRLAGYWEKFSISNNRASDEPHWLQQCHCAKLLGKTYNEQFQAELVTPSLWYKVFCS